DQCARDFFAGLCFAAQGKDRDLWSRVKAYTQEMANAPADVHVAITSQREFTRSVASIFYRQLRRWQKWRLALSSVSVPGENPARKIFPDRLIRHIRIVAERDGRRVFSRLPGELRQHRNWIKSWAPVVIQSNELEAGNSNR